MNKLAFVLFVFVSVFVDLAQANANVRRIDEVEFKDADVRDAARILSTLTGTNVVVTAAAGRKKVDLLLQNTRLKDAIDMLTRVTGLWYRYNKVGNSYIIMTEKQYQEDIVVYRDDIIKTFTLRHQNVNSAALIIQSLFGDRVKLSLQQENDDFEGLPFDSVEEATIVTRGADKKIDALAQIQGVMREASERAISDPKIDLTSGEIRALGESERIDAVEVSQVLGSKTPIFVATNHMHNLLFVRTSDENALSEIAKLIKDNDRPTPQVLLEMKIVKINVGDEFKQDFDLSFNDALNLSKSPELSGSTSVGDFNLDDLKLDVGSGGGGSGGDSDSGSGGNSDLNDLALAMSQIAGNSVTGFGFNSATGGFYEFFSKYVNARIQLLQKNDRAEVIAKPLILASNNRPAKLFLGEEKVIAVSLESDTEFSDANDNGGRSSETTQTLETERRKVGNTLILLPSINADRTVTIDILQDSSQVDRGGLSFPFYDNKSGEISTVNLDSVQETNIKTVVVAKDGLTIALGGMINHEQSEEVSTIPLLGDIPFIGELFRTKNTVDRDVQYIMLITPHILLSPEEAADKSREISEFDYDYYAEPNPDTTRTSFDVSDYVDLTRLMVAVTAGEVPSELAGLKQERIKSKPTRKLMNDEMILFEPVGGWQQNGLFVTRLEVKNESDEEKEIDLSVLSGDWLASSIESKNLGPYSTEGDKTWLYLFSSKPFDTLIKFIR